MFVLRIVDVRRRGADATSDHLWRKSLKNRHSLVTPLLSIFGDCLGE
jgi:hypothetical protein